MKRSKRGEALSLILFAVFALSVLGVIVTKSRHEGTSLYPERAYPYQGKLMIATNEVHKPQW